MPQPNGSLTPCKVVSGGQSRERNTGQICFMKTESIPGYAGRYEATKDGRIYSLKYQRFLTKTIKNGYEYVCLCVNKKKRYYRVHRLIALTFIPNPDNLPEIDHINGNPRDNRICNLQWVTRKANQNNSITRNRLSKALKGRKITWNIKTPYGPGKPINCYKDGVFIRRFKNAIEAERITGIQNGHIYQVLHNKRETAGGYKWEYAL